MLRLSPPGIRALLPVAACCRHLRRRRGQRRGEPGALRAREHYVTALPTHAIGDAAVRALRAEGVRTDRIVRGGDRVGIYFAETGASQRASTVIYDRAHSAISEMAPGAVDWADVLAGAAWFHVTGITPALGDDGAACHARRGEAARAARCARQRGPQLPQEAVDRSTGAGRDGTADAGRRRGRSPTKRTCSRCSASTYRAPTSPAGS